MLRTASRHVDVLLAVMLTLIAQMIISMVSASAPVFAPAIAADRGWSVTYIAFYPVIVYGTAFFLSFQIPVLLSTLGGMGLSVGCLMVGGIGMLCLLSTSTMLLLAAPISIGLAIGAMNPASSQILGPRISPQTAGLIMSIKSTGVPLGIMLAGAVVPALVQRSGWRVAVLQLVLMSTVVGAALLPSVRWLNRAEVPGPRTNAFQSIRPVKRLCALPGMVRFLIAATTFAAMEQCLRTFFIAYLAQDIGLTLTAAGLAFSASQAAGVAGQLLWGIISDRLLSASVTMAIVGVLMTAGAVLTAAITPSWPVTGIVTVAILFGLSAAGFFPLVLGEIARQCKPEETGSLTGAAQVFLIPVALLGPLLFVAIASTVNFSIAFVTLGGCTLIGSIVVGINQKT